MDSKCNVSTYLIKRLSQLGIRHIFSVPGDYTSDFLDAVDRDESIQRIGNCNELNAGYAADGYARANGLGALTVTTGVGSLSVLNAIGGAYVEMVPVVVIIGTLSNTKLLSEMYTGELFHHNLKLGVDQNNNIYKDATVAFERISNPAMAPAQIDAALTACITQKRPVAIEIMEDCYFMPCAEPEGNIKPRPLYTSFSTLQVMASDNPYARGIVNAVKQAAEETVNTIKKAKFPVLWIGSEVKTYGLQDKIKELLSNTQLRWASSLLGKATLSEDTPNFIGIYDGCFTNYYTQSYIDKSDCFIGLGVWSTDLNEFSRKAVKTPQIWASRETVKTPTGQFIQVSLENLIEQVLHLLKERKHVLPTPVAVEPHQTLSAEETEAITYDSFFTVLDSFISPAHFVVADVGLSTFGGSSFLKIKKPGGFLCQAIWASIGWSVPAGLGASFTEGVRPVVIVGDGAFKLTCQEISTMVQEKRNTVIFVLNNGVYAVEQMLLNSKPFEKDSDEPFEAANILQVWDYSSLLKGFSNNSDDAMSGTVNSVADLNNVLADINTTPGKVWLVSINLQMRDYPASWSSFVPEK